MTRRWVPIILILILFASTACAGNDPTTSGRLIVWHTWPEADAAVLQQQLDSFVSTYPAVNLTLKAVDPNEVEQLFRQETASGLGPDVLIGVSSDLAGAWLADGLLLDLNRTRIDTDDLLPASVEAATVDGRLMGLPFTAFTTVMYYNRSIISVPPLTLESLIEQAEADNVIAIPVDFMGSYWGIRAFGGRAFDEEGQLALNENEALANWLDWLASAQFYPSILISTDYNTLADRFAQGQAAVFIGNSADLSRLTQALGDDLWVSPLPGYPEAGSFMTVELMAINSASAQVELAVTLLEFLTNPVQQRQLTLNSSGRIPVGQSVQFNQRLYPIAAALQSQVRRSEIILPANRAQITRLATKARGFYRQVLEGVVTPEEAANQILLEDKP